MKKKHRTYESRKACREFQHAQSAQGQLDRRRVKTVIKPLWFPLPVIFKSKGKLWLLTVVGNVKEMGMIKTQKPEKKGKKKEKGKSKPKNEGEKNRRHLISLLRKSLPSEFGPLRPKLQDSANQALALI